MGSVFSANVTVQKQQSRQFAELLSTEKIIPLKIGVVAEISEADFSNRKYLHG